MGLRLCFRLLFSFRLRFRFRAIFRVRFVLRCPVLLALVPKSFTTSRQRKAPLQGVTGCFILKGPEQV